MQALLVFVFLFFCLFANKAQAAPPFVTYAEQVASGGQPKKGVEQFSFPISNAYATIIWNKLNGKILSVSKPRLFMSGTIYGRGYSVLCNKNAGSLNWNSNTLANAYEIYEFSFPDGENSGNFFSEIHSIPYFFFTDLFG